MNAHIMKTALVIFASMAIASPVFAAFEQWTNKEGKSVELNLVEVTGDGDEMVGNFVMRNGRKTTIKKVDLSEQSAKLLESRTPSKPSVFDRILDDNLVISDGSKFKDYRLTRKPKKYYVYYYTASWCGPCRAFTPQLVKFYNEHKTENFEIVLISSDSEEKEMAAYAKKYQMPWPQLKFSQVATFKGQYNHGVQGIPSVIVCDLEGKIVSTHGRDLAALEQLVK